MLFPHGPFATQIAQLALQAPFVMAVRMADWWMPGALATTRQRREASRMVTEKQAAAMESWVALSTHAMQAWMQCMLQPARPLDMRQLERAGQAMLAPYSRRVRANAARLRRRKR